MATTVDFKIDCAEDTSEVAITPLKRKLNDLTYVTPDKEDSLENPLTLTQASPDITSPDYKKRNVIDPECDLDDTLTTTMSCYNNTTLASTQAEPTVSPISGPKNSAISNQSQLSFEDSQWSVANDAIMAVDLSRMTAFGGLYNRSLSEPSLNTQGGTLPLDDEKPENSEMMDVLKDISTRLHTLEIKGSDTVTNTSLKEIITGLHTPIQEAVSSLQIMVQKHETCFNAIENTCLALENRTKLVSQELKNHIDTTSAEYGELKIAHIESVDQIKEKIDKYDKQTSQMNKKWEDSCELMNQKIGQIDKCISDHEAQYKEINDLFIKAQTTFTPPQHTDSARQTEMMQRTHLDDMMRRSVIIEGVYENRGENLLDLMVQIADTLGIHLYEGEISQARRIGRYKNDMKPRPIKVTFIGEIKRDLFLQHKKYLADSDRFRRVIMFPDDKPEIRKFKAHLRMAADVARKRGDQVWQRFNTIIINGKKYEYRSYSELAIDFPWPGDVRYNTPPTTSGDPDAPKTLETLRRERGLQTTESHKSDEASSAMETDHPSVNLKGAPRKISRCSKLNEDEAMEMIDSLGSQRSVQITCFGIGFFSGECILSNHYKTKFVYNGRDHSSSEQAYFAECAIAAKDPVSFKLIMETNSPRRAKSIGEKIIPGPTWKYIKYDRMYDINLARFTQNEFLKERLLSTRGFALIEASPNSEWASGSGLYSAAMSNGTWRGDNRHGFQLVDIREEIYRSEQADLMRS